MARKFWIFLIIIIFIGNSILIAPKKINAAVALGSGDSYSGMVKINLYGLSKDYYLNKISHGSGAIISSDGIILTNYHVVTSDEDMKKKVNDVGYQICLNKTKNSEPECHYTARLVAADKGNDIALLKIVNIESISSDTSFPFLEIASKLAKTGDKITVYGYPSIGGDTLSQTEGAISGKTEKYDINWLKTDAKISFGNSGGAAIDSDGRIIGITTRSRSDMLDSMGYLIDIGSVKDWIDRNKANQPIASPLEMRMMGMTLKQRNLKLYSSDQFLNNEPVYQISKPADWTFIYEEEDSLIIKDVNDEDGGLVHVYFEKFTFTVDLKNIENIFKKDVLHLITLVNVIKVEEASISGRPGKKIIYSMLGNSNTIYYFPHGNYALGIEYSYGKEDKDKEKVSNTISSLQLFDFEVKPESVFECGDETDGFFIDLYGSGWVGVKNNSINNPYYAYRQLDLSAIVNFSVEKRSANSTGLTNNELYKLNINSVSDISSLASVIGAEAELVSGSSYANIGSNINSAIMTEYRLNKGEATILRTFNYYVYHSDKVFSVGLSYLGEESGYQEAKNSFENMIRRIELAGYQPSEITEEIISYNLSDTDDGLAQIAVPAANRLSGSDNSAKEIIIKNQKLYERLKGKIILKVEDYGKAYYLNPRNNIMYYLGRPDDAFRVMREQGAGITNKDLYKIGIGIPRGGLDTDGDGIPDSLEEAIGLNKYSRDTDGDGYDDKVELTSGYNPWGSGKQSLDKKFSGGQKGKIFIQVEKNGEAWYVNPSDSLRYFLGRPADALSLMRDLGLGISNNDFNNL